MHYIVSVYYHYLMQSFVKNCIFSSIFFIKYITTNVEWGLSFSLYSVFFLIKAKISTCKTANMITFFNINSMHITDLLCPLVEKAISNFLHSSYTIIAQAKYRMYFRTNPLSASSESNTFGMRGLCTFNLWCLQSFCSHTSSRFLYFDNYPLVSDSHYTLFWQS